MIDPQYWASMAPFNANVANARPIPNGQSVTAQPYNPAGTPNQGSQQAPTQFQASGTQNTQPQQPSQNPYDWMQAIIQNGQYQRQQSDQQYQLQLKQLQNERDKIAISRGQAEANAWYNQQQVALAQQKLAEDRRQFDTTTQEAIRQFNVKQGELIRQFDVTTAEGKRQFDAAQAEQKRQFDATFGQRAQEFQQDLDFRKSQLTEGARQYDLSRQDQLDQFAKTYGLDVRKVEEQARQYDLSRADQREQFAADLAERQSEFRTTASGYLDNGQATLEREKFQTDASGYLGNGQATLAREQFQNQALSDWVDKAIALASNPVDWVKYKQQTQGVANNISQIPGLNWTQGGQQGNTTFVGQAQPNSLGNVLGQMGVQQQQQPLTTTTAPQQQEPTGSAGAPVTTNPVGGVEQPVYAGGSPTFNEAAPTQAPATQQPAGSMNWAYQAASMVPTNDQLRAGMSPGEQQIWDTANQFASNPHQAAFGWWEQQDPSTQQMLKGAAQAQGHDWNAVMSRYNRSRWGGPAGSAQAA